MYVYKGERILKDNLLKDNLELKIKYYDQSLRELERELDTTNVLTMPEAALRRGYYLHIKRQYIENKIVKNTVLK